MAASRGGEAMIAVLEQLLLRYATEELLEEYDDQPQTTGGLAPMADE